tara:strand:- start:1833 stop:2423 length:591 start_codon:yes stop_codon:yes gene_type:complete
MKTHLKLIGGQKIESPKTDITRPTTLLVREAIFNILNKEVLNSCWLDLYSGSGSISCEAVNHGAKKVIAIEKNRENVKICKRNLTSLFGTADKGINIEVICKDVSAWIRQTHKKSTPSKIINFEKEKFDFIYLDPPYKIGLDNSILELIFSSNFVKRSTIVIYEHSKNFLVENSYLWEIIDERKYGQTKLSFLIKV